MIVHDDNEDDSVINDVITEGEAPVDPAHVLAELGDSWRPIDSVRKPVP